MVLKPLILLSDVFNFAFSRHSFKFFFICIIIVLEACTMPHRTGYDRKIGDYKPRFKSSTSTATTASVETTEKKISTENKLKKNESSNNKNSSKIVISNSSFEKIIKPWIGTRYKFGGSSRSGTDCSGYVMQIYKTKFNISLPHNAAGMYKMGKAVSADDLQEGDLVFFGNVWGINHVGIYLNGNRFTHASSSQGVTITPLEMDYWKSRYKGARRFVND